MEEIIKEAKDYQLQSLILQFSRFYSEATTNTAGEILRLAIYKAKEECKDRGISPE